MPGGSDSRGTEIELAGLRAGERHELLQRFRLDLRMHDEQHRHFRDVRDRDERGLGVERHPGVEKWIGGQDAGRRHQQRVTVGFRLRDRVGAHIAAGARPVLDDHRLPERLGDFIADRAREHVGKPAGRERRDQADRLAG